jgi:hypothetical protein
MIERFRQSEPDPDHSTLHCPCGSEFTWSGFSKDLEPWMQEHSTCVDTSDWQVPPPTTAMLVERAEKAEARVAELEGFIATFTAGSLTDIVLSGDSVGVEQKNRKPCPISCECLCHDTGGNDVDHPGQPCPGKGLVSSEDGSLLDTIREARAEYAALPAHVKAQAERNRAVREHADAEARGDRVTSEASPERDRARLIIAQARAAGDSLDFGAGLEAKIVAALSPPSPNYKNLGLEATSEVTIGGAPRTNEAPTEDERTAQAERMRELVGDLCVFAERIGARARAVFDEQPLHRIRRVDNPLHEEVARLVAERYPNTIATEIAVQLASIRVELAHRGLLIGDDAPTHVMVVRALEHLLGRDACLKKLAGAARAVDGILSPSGESGPDSVDGPEHEALREALADFAWVTRNDVRRTETASSGKGNGE